jgi:hypothetical protein
MAVDQFRAFERRLARRLAEMQQAAQADLSEIERRMPNSEPRQQAMLEELRHQVVIAVNFALGEGEQLPGVENIRRAETAPFLKAQLEEFARALSRFLWITPAA